MRKLIVVGLFLVACTLGCQTLSAGIIRHVVKPAAKASSRAAVKAVRVSGHVAKKVVY